MTDTVQLHRLFSELKPDDHRLDFDGISELDNDYDLSFLTWPELLERSNCIVVTAAAGAGKTIELKQLQRDLVETNKYAFYIPLDDLARNGFRKSFRRYNNKHDFHDWHDRKCTKTAYFLLDSIDELKLKGESFEEAVRNIRTAIKPSLNRCVFVITSRPWDWRSNEYRDLLTSCLSPEKELNNSNSTNIEWNVLAVKMRPLARVQAIKLAKYFKANNIDIFTNECDRTNNWLYLDRPFALKAAIKMWNSNARLGSISEQRDVLTRELIKEANKHEPIAVSSNDLYFGACKLALALTLSKKKYISTPDYDVGIHGNHDSVDAYELLYDFSESDVDSLLRRGLFDPVGENIVCFQTIEIQEYLTAKCLHGLIYKSKPYFDYKSLIFTSQYGREVISPHMKPIASWLSLWSDEYRDKLLEVDPDCLIRYGDSGSLPLSTKEQLLQYVCDQVKAVERVGWGLSHSLFETHKLAEKKLVKNYVKIWHDNPDSITLRKMVLDSYWYANISTELSIITGSLFEYENPKLFQHSIHALVNCAGENQIRNITRKLIADLPRLSYRHLDNCLSYLFPRYISPSDTIILVSELEKLETVKQSHKSFSIYSMFSRLKPEYDLHEYLNPVSQVLDTQLNNISELKEENIEQDNKYLVKLLAALCRHELDRTNNTSTQLIEHIFTSAVLLGHDPNNSDYEHTHKFLIEMKTKKYVFKKYMKFINKRILPSADNEMFPDSLYHFRITLEPDDLEWLLDFKINKYSPIIAVYVLNKIVNLKIHIHGRDIHKLKNDDILNFCKYNPLLERNFKQRLNASKERNKSARNYKRKLDTKVSKQHSASKKWKKWKSDLNRNHVNYFKKNTYRTTLINIYGYLRNKSEFPQNMVCFQREDVKQHFGGKITKKAYKCFTDNLLNGILSEDPIRTLDGRISGSKQDALQLTAITEAKKYTDWTEELSDKNIENIVRLWFREHSAMQGVIEDVWSQNNKVVTSTIRNILVVAIRKNITLSTYQTIERIGQCEIDIINSVADIVIEELTHWYGPTSAGINIVLEPGVSGYASQERQSRFKALCALAQTFDKDHDISIVSTLAEKRFIANAFCKDAPEWLFLIASHNLEHFLTVVTLSLKQIKDEHVRKAIGCQIFASKHMHRIFNGIAKLEDPEKAKTTAALYKIIASVVRYEDDTSHEPGVVYMPGQRDSAEEMREKVFGALLHCSGPTAYRLIGELKDSEEFAKESIKVDYWLKRRAEDDAKTIEFHKEGDVLHAIKHDFIVPNSESVLWSTVLFHLERLNDFYIHSRFSTKSFLSKLEHEKDVQREIGSRLLTYSDMYHCVLESEVKDSKRIDLEVLDKDIGGKVVIEIKLHHQWTPRELINTLEDQIVSRYLRENDCKSGILLLVKTLDKKRRHPNSNKFIDFEMLINLLNKTAKDLIEKHDFSIRLNVVGIDLS